MPTIALHLPESYDPFHEGFGSDAPVETLPGEDGKLDLGHV